MGSYELPIPRAVPSRLLLVPANIARFAGDWGLAVDEVRLWVCLRELTTHAVVIRPHVADRLRSLLEEFMRGAARDAGGLAGIIGGMDPSDPESIQRLLMDDPEALLGVELSPERTRVARELAALTAALSGYVEHVLDQAGNRLLGDRTLLAEAWRRNQVEGRASMSSTEAFLGLDVGAAQVDRGSAFVKGVVERSGAGRARAPMGVRRHTSHSSRGGRPGSLVGTPQDPGRIRGQVRELVPKVREGRTGDAARALGFGLSGFGLSGFGIDDLLSRRIRLFRHSEVPVELEKLPFGVADDTLPVAPELRVVRRKKSQPCDGAVAELFDHRRVPVVGLHFPVWGDRTEVHDPDMTSGRLGLLLLENFRHL